MYQIRILTLCTALSALVLLMASTATAGSTNRVSDQLASNGLSKNARDSGVAVYIVQLEDAPLASYSGGVAGLPATSPAATGEDKLDANSANSVAYREYLANQQAQALANIEQALGRPVEAIYHYDVTLNGMAMMLSGPEAAIVANLPGVLSVQKESKRVILNDEN